MTSHNSMLRSWNSSTQGSLEDACIINRTLAKAFLVQLQMDPTFAEIIRDILELIHDGIDIPIAVIPEPIPEQTAEQRLEQLRQAAADNSREYRKRQKEAKLAREAAAIAAPTVAQRR